MDEESFKKCEEPKQELQDAVNGVQFMYVDEVYRKHRTKDRKNDIYELVIVKYINC